ncbi:MAG TPA: hypothetical protein VLL48_12435, partial [Longimicrobiales bacterium]|nr:hypothetical protein [Longimicrobiales bacterium]
MTPGEDEPRASTAPSPGSGRPSGVGYAEILAAATLWGSSGVFSVHLFRMGLPPESVALLRPALGLILLAGLLRVGRRRRARPTGSGLWIL